MIPSFTAYSKRYLGIAIIPITITTGILSLSLMRNAIDISRLELIFGLMSITIAVVLTMMMDLKGYCFYSVRAFKFYETEANQQRFLQYEQKNYWRKSLCHTTSATLISSIFTLLFSILAYQYLPNHLSIFILIFGCIILPFFVVYILRSAWVYEANKVMKQLKGISSPAKRQAKDIYFVIGMELVISLMVNYGLVMPIRKKTSFDLTHGYHDIAFMIGFFILLLIVCAFMLSVTLKHKRYIIAGDIMMRQINAHFCRQPWAITQNMSRLARYCLYIVILFFWVLITCPLLTAINAPISFFLIYSIGLLPIIAMYTVERYQTLFESYHQAHGICQRLDAQYGVLMLENH